MSKAISNTGQWDATFKYYYDRESLSDPALNPKKPPPTFKKRNPLSLTACLVAAAYRYDQCVAAEDQRLVPCLSGCQSTLLSPAEQAACAQACQDAHFYGVMACGTQYTADSLGCLAGITGANPTD